MPYIISHYYLAIHRHLTGPKVNRCINISKDTEFNRSNAMLKCMIGKSLSSGKKKAQYPAIAEEDLEKIGKYFNQIMDEEKLQQFVWFQVAFKLGLRGRELHHQMERSWLKIELDASGRRYAHVDVTYLSKNVKASLTQKEYENLAMARFMMIL